MDKMCVSAVLQQVTVIRSQVAQIILFGKSHVLRDLGGQGVSLLVVRMARIAVDDSCNYGQTAPGQAHTVTGDILRLVLFEKDVNRNNATQVAESNLPCTTDGASEVASEVHIEPADNDWHGRVSAHGDEEQPCILHVAMVMYTNFNGKSSDCNSNRKHDKEKPVAETVANGRHSHGKGKGDSPRGNTAQLGLDVAVVELLDNTRSKVGVAVGRDNEAKVGKAASNNLVVLEDSEDVTDLDGAVGAGATDIGAKTILNVLALLLGQPFDLFGEIGDHKVEEEADKDGEAALDDEDPAPCLVALQAVHLANGRGKKTTKSTGQGRTVEEEGVSLLRFASLIPHADEVKRCTELRVSMSWTEYEVTEDIPPGNMPVSKTPRKKRVASRPA